MWNLPLIIHWWSTQLREYFHFPVPEIEGTFQQPCQSDLQRTPANGLHKWSYYWKQPFCLLPKVKRKRKKLNAFKWSTINKAIYHCFYKLSFILVMKINIKQITTTDSNDKVVHIVHMKTVAWHVNKFWSDNFIAYSCFLYKQRWGNK